MYYDSEMLVFGAVLFENSAKIPFHFQTKCKLKFL